MPYLPHVLQEGVVAISFNKAVIFAAGLLAAAVATAAPGNPVLGKEKAEAERCLECHGEAGPGQGMSTADGRFARLDGQYAEYLVKQVHDFRKGARKNDFMQMMAKSLDDADLADIAAYFASLPAKEPKPEPKPDAQARALFEQGDASRNLLACASCHGAGGKGVNAATGPILRGQAERYLVQQLHDWKTGVRRNSAGGVMNSQAALLSDAEIAALARYLSAP